MISTVKVTTWRTSSEDPNIQNWPKRDEGQKEVRKQIRPPAGFKVVSFDYGQIQARNVAMESKDKALVKAFWDNYDIHSVWMEKIAKAHPKWWKLPKDMDPKDYKKKKRNEAKNGLVFPSFFGAQAGKISAVLGIPRETAEALHEEFWDAFPDILKWHKRIKRFYSEEGYVTGCTGFRRRAPINSNQLINAPIQADEAAIVCDAMYRLSQQGIQAAMEIHDDLTFIWPAKEVDKLADAVITSMCDCPFEWARIVPIVVEMSIGDDWHSTKAVGEYSSETWKGKR